MDGGKLNFQKYEYNDIRHVFKQSSNIRFLSIWFWRKGFAFSPKPRYQPKAPSKQPAIKA